MFISIIAGGAGFVGCNLLPILANEERHLVVMDNLCRGREEHLKAASAVARERVQFIHVDLSDLSATLKAFEMALNIGAVDEVWHLAANSDIRQV